MPSSAELRRAGPAIVSRLGQGAPAAALGQTVEPESALMEQRDVYVITEAVSQVPGPRTIRIERSWAGSVSPPGPSMLILLTGSRVGIAHGGRVEATIEMACAGEQVRGPLAQGLDILALGSVRTELLTTHNEQIGASLVDAAFVYRVPTVASGAPLVPLIDRPEPYRAPSDRVPFGDHLATMLGDLLGRAPEEVLGAISLNVLGSYEPELAPGLSATGDGVHFPGLRRTGLQLAEWPGWMGRYAAAGSGRAVHRPPGPSRIVLDLRLFETASSRLLLRVRRYEINLTAVL
ncbi:MAG TPA: hypothetical protein VGU24_22010 [Microvirga sp.]|jgi:hypothetical protein|nr:hypothetical protein [Microvirga sp.]